jgi:hypothetical protein
MDSKKLADIKNKLSMLPELKDRLKKLNDRIYKEEQNVQKLLSELNAESYDVEKLQKDTLSVTLLRVIGRYEGRLDKEMQEALAAKLNYDKAADTVIELKNEGIEISGRITELENESSLYEEELKNREKVLMNNINDETAIKYKQLEAERKLLTKQLLETKEAARAASKVKNSADEVINQLNSADDWATYDVFTKGGIFSHMAKYEHIDNAQSEINRLAIQLKELRKELSDVNLLDNLEITNIDNAARAFDFWFDNIFTDLNIRDKIRNDIEKLMKLCSQVDSIIEELQNVDLNINNKLDDIESRKKDLLINE